MLDLLLTAVLVGVAAIWAGYYVLKPFFQVKAKDTPCGGCSSCGSSSSDTQAGFSV